MLEQLKLQQPPWAAGYRVRVLDGNHLAASQKRLKPLRGLQAAFLIREHGRSPHPSEVEPLKKVGRVETGVVFEQAVEVEDEQGRRLRLRRIELQWDEPTEDGDSCIRLLTNVPAERMGAKEVAGLYRRCWSIEGMFDRLELVLKSEVSTLGYPRAALLAFGVAVMAYNVLAVMLAAVVTEHRLEPTGLPSYDVADEVKATYGGMLIAIPEKLWRGFESETDEELGKQLRRLASHVKLAKLRKHPRGPNKKVKKGYAPRREVDRHVSTAWVLRGDENT